MEAAYIAASDLKSDFDSEMDGIFINGVKDLNPDIPNKESLRGIPEDFFGLCQSRVRVPTKGQQKEWRKRIP